MEELWWRMQEVSKPSHSCFKPYILCNGMWNKLDSICILYSKRTNRLEQPRINVCLLRNQKKKVTEDCGYIWPYLWDSMLIFILSKTEPSLYNNNFYFHKLIRFCLLLPGSQMLNLIRIKRKKEKYKSLNKVKNKMKIKKNGY